MSDRPTPETDAAWAAESGNGLNEVKEISRKLERERNEARELIDDIWITATSDHRFIMPPSKKQIPQHIEGIIKAYDKAHDDWTPEEIKTLMRERDEAREELRTAVQERHDFHWQLLDAVRERNEARTTIEDAKRALNAIGYEGLLLAALRVKEERDEAREKYDNLATEHMLAINKICNERDEAREIAQQLIHIASHCLGWHDNTNPETITDAIKRWNASTKK